MNGPLCILVSCLLLIWDRMLLICAHMCLCRSLTGACCSVCWKICHLCCRTKHWCPLRVPGMWRRSVYDCASWLVFTVGQSAQFALSFLITSAKQGGHKMLGAFHLFLCINKISWEFDWIFGGHPAYCFKFQLRNRVKTAEDILMIGMIGIFVWLVHLISEAENFGWLQATF